MTTMLSSQKQMNLLPCVKTPNGYPKVCHDILGPNGLKSPLSLCIPFFSQRNCYLYSSRGTSLSLSGRLTPTLCSGSRNPTSFLPQLPSLPLPHLNQDLPSLQTHPQFPTGANTLCSWDSTLTSHSKHLGVKAVLQSFVCSFFLCFFNKEQKPRSSICVCPLHITWRVIRCDLNSIFSLNTQFRPKGL